MTSQRLRPIAFAAIVLLSATASIGCGISKDSSPRPIAPDRLTPELIAPTTTAP